MSTVVGIAAPWLVGAFLFFAGLWLGRMRKLPRDEVKKIIEDAVEVSERLNRNERMTVARRVSLISARKAQERRDLAAMFMMYGRGAIALHALGVGKAEFFQLVAKHELKHSRRSKVSK